MENEKIGLVYVGQNSELYGYLQDSVNPSRYSIDNFRDLTDTSQLLIDGVIVDAECVNYEFMKQYHRLNADSQFTYRRGIPLMVVGSGKLDLAREIMDDGSVDYYTTLDNVENTARKLSHRIRELTFERNVTPKYTEPPVVLSVDDEQAVRSGLKAAFEHHGYNVRSVNEYPINIPENEKTLLLARNRKEAFVGAFRNRIGAVIMDLRLEEDEGLNVAKRLQQSCPFSPFIFWTAFAEDTTYAESMIEGLAFDYLTKEDGGFELLDNPVVEGALRQKQRGVTEALRNGTPHLYALVGGRYAGKSDVSIYAANAHPTIIKQKSLTDRALRTGSDAELWKDMREKEVVSRSYIEKRRDELVVLERKGDDYMAARDPEMAWDLLSQGYDVIWVVGDPEILPELKERFGSFYRGVRFHVPLPELEERMIASKRGNENDKASLLEKIAAEQSAFEMEFHSQSRRLSDFIHCTIANSAIRGVDDEEAFVPTVSNLVNYINLQRQSQE